MLDGSILKTIDQFWDARMAGDKAAVHTFLAPQATYEMIGAKAIADPIAVGPAPAGPAADRLMDDFKFHSLERITAVVEGRKAAVVSKLEVSFRGGTPVVTESCDVWEFDESGKVTSIKQFVDTDLVRRMLAGGT
jgi:ketosteroid isomerase-like protein